MVHETYFLYSRRLPSWSKTRKSLRHRRCRALSSVDRCHAELLRGPLTIAQMFLYRKSVVGETADVIMLIFFSTTIITLTLNSFILIDFSKIGLILCHSIFYFWPDLSWVEYDSMIIVLYDYFNYKL